MSKINFIPFLIMIFFSGCIFNQKNIKYTNDFFIIEKNIKLTKDDFRDIEYKKIKSGNYLIRGGLTKVGYKKLHNFFKDTKGKSAGLLAGDNIINFNLPIIDELYDEPYSKNDMFATQMSKENAIIFLKSLNIEFKE